MICNNVAVVYFFLAPSAITYDNACQLHAYCLNRDPEIFKDKAIVMDRFH